MSDRDAAKGASRSGAMPSLAELEIPLEPSLEDREAILAALVRYNRSAGPETTARPLSVLIREESGSVAGGLWGKTIYDWLVVELVVVPEERRGRGLGRKLMLRAEAEARERDCIGAWLDTFSFQARGFYEKLGYKLVGTIEGHPREGARFILAKRFGSEHGKSVG